MSIVRFDQVSKRFTLRHERPRSLQELFLNVTHLKKRRASKEKYWALREVSFEVKPGEMVGIIGPNGAGKSTILKLISRIIEPSSGRVEADGRIGALLELGAGFHAELTGRENVYLNGSILGLSRREVKRKLDDIVAFAELERFIDAPVKHYSSGMFVRLGFSIAVHTRPDILLIDEVLSVGDAAFQEKCLEKVSEIRRGDCTVVFVSHVLESVQELCTKTIWLENGRIRQMGETDRVVSNYVREVEEQHEANLIAVNKGAWSGARDQGDLRIRDVKMLNAEGRAVWTFQTGEPVYVQVAYGCGGRIENPVFSILIHRSDGLYVSSTNTYDVDPTDIGPIEGKGELVVEIDRLDLYGGDYSLSVAAYLEPDPPFWSSPSQFLDRQFNFRVVSEGRHGVVAIPASWDHQPQE